MTSNMLSGERRWASSKRSGMTVIGKIVVPKPINLPSQKSENHGLDPNVEIVPKGTLTWGSKSSSAWGSASPNTDGGSPSHLSGRPSSGSGTRPSTASSDRAHDLSSNSRPASASGALTTNQTSLASLRPRSAETRPGSSQLSRFAENSEHPAAWNVAGAAEKLGATSSKNDEFSLTSGDFPTLGSGKESCGKKSDLQDSGSYGRPGSSSGRLGTPKEVVGASGAGDSFTVENAMSSPGNSWRRDNPPYTDDGGRPVSEKWHVNPQAYAGPPLQHYDAWHGPPVNNPHGGGWFRGPPGGPPPYGNQVGPGGYPMEPYSYYRPQIPASSLPNSQPAPPPGPMPRGPHPKNGDMYRPHMPDHFIRPGMVGPRMYPSPVSSYYNPPMGYCGPNGPNDRDVQYMGMPAGPPTYNRYPVQVAPEPGNHHGRSGGYGQTNQGHMGEQAESGHPQEHQGPYKVLLKHHDGRDRKNGNHRVEDEWRSDRNKEGERNFGKEVNEEASFQTFDNQGSGSVPPTKIYPGGDSNPKAADDLSGKKLESESFVSSKDPQPLLSTPKDSSLIQKIEGLNAKARASDGLDESITIPEQERQNKKFHANTKATHHSKESGGGSVHADKTSTGVVNPVSHEGVALGGDKNNLLDLQSGAGANISRKPTQSRADHHNRGRFNTQELDGGQNKPLIAQPPVMVPAVHLENSNNLHQDHQRPTEVSQYPGPHAHGKAEGQSVPPVYDRSDSKEQRAKMKELAMQRKKQLQEEEEERNKRQMAKSRALLEELNKRTLAAEESTQNLEKSTQNLENSSTGVVVQSKQNESHIPNELPKSGRRVIRQSSKPNSASQSSNENKEQSSEPPNSVCEAPLPMPTQQQEVKSASSAHHDNAPHVHEANVSKQKRSSSKQKQPASTTEAPKPLLENVTTSLGTVAGEVVQSGVPNCPPETSAHPPKRSGKNGKNKQKTEDRSVLSTTVREESLANVSLETVQPKASSENQPNSSTVVDGPYEQNPTLPNEDSHGIRGNSHWKPKHQSLKVPRSQQSNRTGGEKSHSGDAVVWAPVRSQHKPEPSDELSPQNVADEIIPAVKSDNQAPNNSKNKRAEMERYVPKPVAKEMAQQGGNIQNPVAPIVNQTPPTDDSAPENSRKTGISVASKNGNNRHYNNNKQQQHQHQQGKTHGSWRQRGLTEDGSSYSSNITQNLPKPTEPEVTISAKDQEKYSDGGNDWGISDNSAGPALIPPPVKDQGSGSRGKRHASKGHNKGSVNPRDHDQKKSFGDETEKNSAQYSHDHSAPHWLPKSQPLSANTQRGNRQNSGQNLVLEVPLENKPEPTYHRPKSGNAEQVPNPRHFEPRRERKPAPLKGQGPSNPAESEPRANFEPKQLSSSSSGLLKSGNYQSAHFSHGQEARGDWNNYSGQDNNKQNNREMRPRQNNQRYEYQPIATSQSNNNNNNKVNIYHFEGSKDISADNSGVRGRGRGQNHSRRGGGNFYGRQSGVRVDAVYE